eukprot:Gregarina_sp_Pseudo_9__5612@NODE_770_length_2237_cov_90_345769_g725_i0_p1_GENE_NODE_770_length_2237_cov_90_345769_g725_i0NODE_770_length_2237_cov_90_345769_g725_i0_p1_ORF_typecomplete_len666_score100_23GST_C_3/PF14497_6/0_012GST_C_3/PF14497_6/67_NODE_770_length_2237_cov_90_345769_g725_i01282125
MTTALNDPAVITVTSPDRLVSPLHPVTMEKGCQHEQATAKGPATVRVRETPRSAGCGLRVPCKGWRGLHMKAGFRSPRYRHSNYIQVVRQQQKSAQTPAMKSGFPPCKHHGRPELLTLVLYDLDQEPSPAEFVRLACVVGQIRLREVRLHPQRWHAQMGRPYSPTLMYRNTMHNDMRTIYSLLAQLGALRPKAVDNETRSWMYIGMLQDFVNDMSSVLTSELNQDNSKARIDRIVSHGVPSILKHLNDSIQHTQTSHGYVFKKGVLTFVEVAIAGIVHYLEKLIGPDKWPAASQCLPALKQVKNLVYSNAAVSKWLQQKTTIECVVHPDTWEAKVAQKWFEINCIRYKIVEVSKEEWSTKLLKEYPLLPAILVSTSAPVCGLHAIASWLLTLQSNSARVNWPLEEVWEHVDSLSDLWAMTHATADNALTDETLALHWEAASDCRPQIQNWISDGASAVFYEEVCALPRFQMLPSQAFQTAQQRSVFVTSCNEIIDLAHETLTVACSKKHKDLGLMEAIKLMCDFSKRRCEFSVQDSESSLTLKQTTYVGAFAVMSIVSQLTDLTLVSQDNEYWAEMLLSIILNPSSLDPNSDTARLSASTMDQLELFASQKFTKDRTTLESFPTWIDFVLASVVRAREACEKPNWPTLTSLEQYPISQPLCSNIA